MGFSFKPFEAASTPEYGQNAPSLVYDPDQEKLFVPDSGGVWEFANDEWTFISTGSPYVWTTGQEVAVHPPDGTLVASIYNSAANAKQTWVYDGSSWTNVLSTTFSPAPSPPWPQPMGQTVSLIWMPSIGKVVCVSEERYNSGFDPSETWTWDGSSWTQLSPADPPLLDFVAAPLGYDPVREVLVGAFQDTSTAPWTDTEIREFDGTDWSLVAGSLPYYGSNWQSVAFDENLGVTLLLPDSSNSLSSSASDLYTWDGTDFAFLNSTPPTAWYGMQMAFFPPRNEMALYGVGQMSPYYDDPRMWFGRMNRFVPQITRIR